LENLQENWDIEINSNKSWFDLQLKEIWKYRDLLLLFVRRDIVSFYKQTVLGPLWYFIQPIFTTIVFTFVFGNLAGLSTGGLPQPLFYLSGITAWNYFSDCLLKTSTIFRDNQGIFGKVYFPRVISPLSIVISNLLKFGIQMLLFLIMVSYYLFQKENIIIGWEIFLFPIFVLFMAMQGLGLGMIITSLTTKYRDLVYLVSFGIQLMMYAAPVIYSLSSLSGKMYWIVALNPMSFVIEGIRNSILGEGILTFETFLYTFSISLIILFLGLIIFNKTQKDFIDTI
jgi:lipopolysaccharide transport system permease protein